MKSSKSEMYYDPELSLTKLIVYFNDGNMRTFYSNMRRDRAIGMVRSGLNLIERLIVLRFRHKYMSAVLIENATGEILEKWYCDRKTDSSIS